MLVRDRRRRRACRRRYHPDPRTTLDDGACSTDRAALSARCRHRRATASSTTGSTSRSRRVLRRASARRLVRAPRASGASLRPGFLVGRRSIPKQEAIAASRPRAGATTCCSEPYFASESKPEGHVAAGLEALSAGLRRVRLPVLAIGGITVDRAAAVARAGAAGIAGIGVFSRAADIAAVVTGLRSSFDT